MLFSSFLISFFLFPPLLLDTHFFLFVSIEAPRRPEGYTYPRGTTEVLSETRELFAQVQVTDVPTPMEM